MGFRYHLYLLALYVQQMFPSLGLPYFDTFCDFLVSDLPISLGIAQKFRESCDICNTLLAVTKISKISILPRYFNIFRLVFTKNIILQTDF